MVPIGFPSRSIGTARTLRKSRACTRSRSAYSGSSRRSGIWTTARVRMARAPAAPRPGRMGYTRRRESATPGLTLARAARCSSSPSNVVRRLLAAPQSSSAFWVIVSNTGCTSVGELLITLRISAVAVCCSTNTCSRWSASARRFSRSRTLAPSSFGDVPAGARVASALPLVDLTPRPISLSLPPTAQRSPTA